MKAFEGSNPKMNDITESLYFSIVEEYGDMIYRFALHYVKNRADAEDVVQEVLLAYLKHSHPEKEKLKGWLLKVTKNQCLNLIKKQKRVVFKEPEGEIAEFPMDHGLFEALQTLSPLDREIVYLFYQEGYSSKEIGKFVKKSDAAVRKHLERAKKQLKVYLEENQ